jgi:hypothetical protein
LTAHPYVQGGRALNLGLMPGLDYRAPTKDKPGCKGNQFRNCHIGITSECCRAAGRLQNT